MRFQVIDRPGVMAQITSILGENRLSIASIIQHEAQPHSGEMVELVIMTHEAPEGAARQAVEQIAKLPCVAGHAVRMRVIDKRRNY